MTEVHSHTSVLVPGGLYSSTSTKMTKCTLLKLFSRIALLCHCTRANLPFLLAVLCYREALFLLSQMLHGQLMCTCETIQPVVSVSLCVMLSAV